MFILMTGNPFDGMHAHGPFEDGDVANEYGNNHYSDSDWWVATLNKADLDKAEGPVGDPWAEHPLYSVTDWQYEVANGDTRYGYRDWCESMEACEEEEAEVTR